MMIRFTAFTVIMFALLASGCDGAFGISPKPVSSPAASSAIREAPQAEEKSPPKIQEVPVIVHEVRDTSRVDVQPGGGLRVVGPATVEIIDRAETDEQFPTLERRDSGQAIGAGVSSDGDDVKVDQVGQPSRVSLADVDAQGIGGGASNGEAGGSATTTKAARDTKGIVLFALGGLAIIAGALVAGLWSRPWAGMMLALGGAGCIGMGVFAAEQPMILIAGLAALIVAGVVVFIVDSRRIARDNVALQSVAAGVESYEEKNPEAGKQVKAEISRAAGKRKTVVKDVVTAAKQSAGL